MHSGKYVREKEVGIASLFCSPLDIAAASKSVIFYDRSSQHIVGRLAVALQYKNTADKSPSKSRPSLQHNPREVAFLLSREMRRSDAARRSFPLPPHRQDRVTFNDNTERIVRREVRRNNFTSLPRPRYAEPTASPSAEKRIQYDRSRNSSPKLRDTAMSVGYVKNKWPDVSDSIMEKSMYRLHLSEQRRYNDRRFSLLLICLPKLLLTGSLCCRRWNSRSIRDARPGSSMCSAPKWIARRDRRTQWC